MAMAKRIDVRVSNHGSLFLFDILSRKAKRWTDEHIGEDAQWWAGALVVEHRCAHELADGMMADGLRVE